MISINTNVSSLIAQDNMRMNTEFQAKTIQRLTSGLRINSSGDDAAGLSIANQFHSDTMELSQGVRNANDGVSQLQIVDGGLGNIGKMLNRMKTLATQSASATFSGSRATLDAEYQQLSSEITRQAADIGLNSGGLLNKNLSVYIGGGRTSTQSGSSSVQVDLSAAAVDANSLHLTGTTVAGGSAGVDFGFGAGNQRLDSPASNFLAGGGNSQDFVFNYTDVSGNVQNKTVSLVGGASGISGSAALAQLNAGLVGTGIVAAAETATVGAGKLQFTGTGAFTIYAGTPTGGSGVATSATSVVNNAEYSLTNAASSVSASAENFTISDGTNFRNVVLDSSQTTTAAMVAAINAQLANGTAPDATTGHQVNVKALLSANGASISFQSSAVFSFVETQTGTTGGIFAAVGNQALTGVASTTSTAGSAAQSAIAAINAAVTSLGTVQGVVGSGQNKLGYAINLAQSQISNFSAAEAQIRDADVAAEAANLTKAQVLLQASVAAMAQANAAPQMVLKLLQ